MFTGIVQARGEIVAIEPKGGFTRIAIASNLDLSDVKEGDSIAVDGACLTVTQVEKVQHRFRADVSPETMRVTTLGGLKVGHTVNLEKALRLDSRLGGHLVSGHVDCVGRVVEKRIVGPGYLMGFQVASDAYLIPKGSVAIDGVSLTVNQVENGRFSVMIIPHTAALTGLTEKKINDRVNVEFDMIGKYVEKFVTAMTGERGVSEQKLKEYGFL